MADLDQLIATGKLLLYTEDSFDNDLSSVQKKYIVNFKSSNVSFIFPSTEEKTYRVDQFSGENTKEINCYGRLCIHADIHGNIHDDGIGGINGIAYIRGSNNASGNPYFYELAEWEIPKAHTTTAPDGDLQPLGNTDLAHYIEFNVKFPGPLFSYDTVWGVRGQSSEFTINIPIFTSQADADEYIRTGDASKAINPIKPVESDPEASFYYYDYELDKINTNTHQIVERGETQSAKFKMINSSDYVAFVRDAGKIYHLASNADYVLTYNSSTRDYDIKTPLSDVYIEIINGTDGDKVGDIYTNIPFVESLEDALNIGKDDYSYNGIDENMDLTEITVNGSFIGAYYVSVSELNQIASIIYSNDATIEAALKSGLWMYGENPIDCVVDLCLYPFSLSPFISGQSQSNIKFGSYEYNGSLQKVYNKVTGTNKSLTLVNQRVIPIYNDFRDYNTVTYSIFLPYYGIIPLPDDVVGNMLKVVVYFDIFTSQMKYYIYINGSILTVVECSVGRHMSVVGSNWITKSGQNVNDFTNTLQNAANVAGSIQNLNVGGVLNGLIGGLQSTMNYLSKPTTAITGSTTGGMNIYDPMSCYLIIEQFETIKPNNLNSEYGLPCYNIKNLNGVSGFVQISDCKLKTHATEAEQNEILTLLKAGVII